jgi:hypothetical protein
MLQPKVIDKKGMDAIFSGVGTPKYGVGSQDSGVIKPESVLQSRESENISKESGVGSPESVVNMSVLNQAIKQGRTENPRISSWNPLVMAVLRYRNLTTPAYSMSKEISELLEIAVKERYPELSEQVKAALAKK